MPVALVDRDGDSCASKFHALWLGVALAPVIGGRSARLVCARRARLLGALPAGLGETGPDGGADNDEPERRKQQPAQHHRWRLLNRTGVTAGSAFAGARGLDLPDLHQGIAGVRDVEQAGTLVVRDVVRIGEPALPRSGSTVTLRYPSTRVSPVWYHTGYGSVSFRSEHLPPASPTMKYGIPSTRYRW